MLHVAPVSSRNQFGKLLTERKLLGDAVEIGTHRGEFAATLLASWTGRLVCVDPWSVPPGYEKQAESLLLIGGTGDRQADYDRAREVLSPYKGRVLFMRCLSADAVRSFGDDTLDFVHVDGDHEVEGVSQDLRLWWPKVRPGGILAGHDFLCPGEPDGGWGRNVQRAVQRFVVQHGVDVHVIVEPETMPWSFYLEKL